MSRKIVLSLMALFFAVIVFVNAGYSMQRLNKEQALEAVFGMGADVVTESKALAEPKLSEVKEQLAGDSKGKGEEFGKTYDFYFSVKDGKRTGVAMIDEEPGKWGIVQFMIAMDMAGAVSRVEVMKSSEKRGQPISRHSFMSQFEGKTHKDPFKVGKDVHGISGATISSSAAAFAVKKAVVLYNVLYLNK